MSTAPKSSRDNPIAAKRRELETPNRALATLRRSLWHAKFTAASSAACQSYASSGHTGTPFSNLTSSTPPSSSPQSPGDGVLQLSVCTNCHANRFLVYSQLPATTSGLRWKVLDKRRGPRAAHFTPNLPRRKSDVGCALWQRFGAKRYAHEWAMLSGLNTTCAMLWRSSWSLLRPPGE